MSFTGNYMCTSFKKESLQAIHDFSVAGDVFKIALYTDSASFNAATEVYTSVNEVTGSGYVAGGKALVNIDPVALGTTGLADFEDAVWTASTIVGARGAMIYNSTNGNRAVAILDFGSDKTTTNSAFTVEFPVAAASTAIVRYA
jgi:hypothetical protein